jgi:type II secretory pathway pseudopilin PulG
VLAIIGLLATIAVPVYVNKMEQAKVTAAKHEIGEIANAEEVCGIMHGFYVPLSMLDDIPYRSGTRPNAIDDIENTEGYLDPYLIQTGVSIEEQRTGSTGQVQLSQYNSLKSVGNIFYGWQGPFINFKRYYLGEGIYVLPANPDEDDVAHDYPLDPWGNPYIMITEDSYIVDPDGFISSTQFAEHQFDRMTILSLGPDGTSNIGASGGITYTNPSGDDDLWTHFGSSGLRPETYY